MKLTTSRRTLISALAAFAAVSTRAMGSPNNAGKNARDLALPTDPVLGNSHGDVTLLDFYDIRCPPCRQMEPRIQRLILADMGLKYIPVDYPLFGGPSELAARALLSAQTQGRYAEFKAWLFEHFEQPSLNLMQRAATALALDWDKMKSDMQSAAIDSRLQANMARGAALGVKILPVMLLGPIVIPGALHYDDLADLVKSARQQQA